jgi:class 3 adenylate cyclase
VAPETRYTTSSGDLSIAYQVAGDGPPDIMVVPGFISHADYQWEIGPYRGLLETLSSVGRMAVFDKRGIGLSDRNLGLGTIEDRMDDIRAVMDAVAMDRAHVVSVSEGGPLAVLFAATYPERVQSLTLWASFSRILHADDYPWGATEESAEAFVEAVSAVWGTGMGTRFMVKGLPTDDESVAVMARLERAAATPNGVRAILTNNNTFDVREVLPTVSAPALVINRTDDPLIPVEGGAYLAEHIPGATFLELPGDWHVNADADAEVECFDAIVEFITGDRPAHVAEVDRVLATVLFTDICDSTARAAELGDHRWKELLARHDTLAAQEVQRHRGTLVKTTGDGLLATFDGPARAVRCAQAVRNRVGSLGIDIRAGVHTGEIERQGDDVAGIGVHIGARVAGLAGPEEVLASQTVKDLVLGSGLEFEPRGIHQLKGVPGDWQLYAVAG